MKVPVLYHSQAADECVNLYDKDSRDALKNRQFEWTSCGEYHDEIEFGLVKWELSDEYLPVAVGGEKTANRGVKGQNFNRWFKAVDGLSEKESGEIELDDATGVLTFEEADFHPIEGLFTMHFGLPFVVTASGEERFEITADDDTFVFVGNKLVLDMGGIHSPTTGVFVISKKAEVYAGVAGESLAYSGVNLKGGESEVIRIFHANRDGKNSVFGIRVTGMNISTMEKAGETVVTFDPTVPGYMAPLGETMTVALDEEKILATANTVKVMSFGLIAVVAVAIICAAVKCWQRVHNQE